MRFVSPLLSLTENLIVVEMKRMANLKTKMMFVTCLMSLLTAIGCDLGTYEKRLEENSSAETRSGNSSIP